MGERLWVAAAFSAVLLAFVLGRCSGQESGTWVEAYFEAMGFLISSLR